MTHPFMDGIQSAFPIYIYIYGTHFVIFHHSSINLFIFYYLRICGLFHKLLNWEYPTMDVTPSIGFLSSSKWKFRDQFWYFWLGKILGKLNPTLTPGVKNPKILKLVVLVHSLYLDIEEVSGAEIFPRQR